MGKQPGPSEIKPEAINCPALITPPHTHPVTTRFQATERIISRFVKIPATGVKSNRGLVAIYFD